LTSEKYYQWNFQVVSVQITNYYHILQKQNNWLQLFICETPVHK